MKSARPNDPLCQPYTLKHLMLKNRVMITSHEPAYPEDGMPKARYRAYHVERAKAGIAMTMTAGSASVSKDSPPAFNNILAYKDEVVPWLKKLTDEIHSHDCAVMIQLTHLGRRTGWDKGDWLPSVAPTHQREPAHLYAPKLIEDWDIARIITDYANAAERMKAGGVDGIELEAYGHLMDQFWSPLTNHLENGYGGSLDNRLKFLFEVISAIRNRIGNDFILGIRMVVDEVQKGGLTRTEGFEIARRLKEDGQIDFLNIIRGRIHTDAALADVIPIQGMRASPHLDFAGDVRKTIGLPTFHAAKISDIATARHAIASGLIDMVGMTRAHMADPHIMRKVLEGREDDIRPCVGATYCLDRIYQGEAALCIHNPSTGRELTLPHDTTVSPSPKKVVIVGAGPAGLEAARVAKLRGHNVIVFEAANEPGGQIRLAAQSQRRRDMLGIVDWRMAQCNGVEFRFNTWAEISDVLTEEPDTVIVATGGFPDTNGFEAGADLIVSAWDILSGDIKPGQNVLLYDEVGDHSALQAADKIAQSGAHLEILTPDRSFAPEMMGVNLVPYMRSLQDKDVLFTVARRLLSVSRDGNYLKANIGTDYSDHWYTKNYDQIIVNKGVVPMDDLYFDLKPLSNNFGEVNYEALITGNPQNILTNPDGAFQLFRIGDAVSGRNIHAAIYDALRLVREI